MTTSSSSSAAKSRESRLFDPPEWPEIASHAEPTFGRVRVKSPVRDQQQMCLLTLDERVPLDSRVRAVWDFVVKADLSDLFNRIRAVEGGAGRDAIDPRILMCLWLFATVEGISQARHIERLTKENRSSGAPGQGPRGARATDTGRE